MKKPSKVKGNPLCAIAYLRVSTDDQHLGIAAQQASIQKWADGRGVHIGAWFCDKGVSGGAQVADRPELLLAFAAINVGCAGFLVAAKRDRFARDVMVAAIIERMANDAGAEVVSAAGEGEGASPEAKLMRTIVDAISEWERATIRARTVAALAVKKARGEVLGQPPFGSRREGDRFVQDAGEQRTLAHLWRWKKASPNASLRQVAAAMDADGFTTRGGGKWSAEAVRRVLARATQTAS